MAATKSLSYIMCESLHGCTKTQLHTSRNSYTVVQLPSTDFMIKLGKLKWLGAVVAVTGSIGAVSAFGHVKQARCSDNRSEWSMHPSVLQATKKTIEDSSSSILSRRDMISKLYLLCVPLLAVPTAAYPETVGKDPDCNDADCLGVWEGLLANCPQGERVFGRGGGAGCVSSQDDTPGAFAEPLDYSEAEPLHWEEQVKRLSPAIQRVTARRKGDEVRFVFREGRYLRAIFHDGKTGENSVGEFYFTPDDTTVQFRLASLRSSSPSLMSYRNIERSEEIRKELGYLKLPVLRNRKRTLIFGESDLDTFGPRDVFVGSPEELPKSAWNQQAETTDFFQKLPF